MRLVDGDILLTAAEAERATAGDGATIARILRLADPGMHPDGGFPRWVRAAGDGRIGMVRSGEYHGMTNANERETTMLITDRKCQAPQCDRQAECKLEARPEFHDRYQVIAYMCPRHQSLYTTVYLPQLWVDFREGGNMKTLTKKEKRHLRVVAGVRSLAEFGATAAEQAQMRRVEPRVEPCFACKAIARKLGLEV